MAGLVPAIHRRRRQQHDLRRRRLIRGIEDLRALVLLVDSKKDQRDPVLHDQYGGQDQRGNVQDVPLNSFGFQSGAPGSPVVQGNRQPTVQYREASQQGFAANGATVVGGKVCQRGGEGIVAERPAAWLGRPRIRLVRRRMGRGGSLLGCPKQQGRMPLFANYETGPEIRWPGKAQNTSISQQIHWLNSTFMFDS